MDEKKWAPNPGHGRKVEDVSLDEWIGQALGAASTCWENLGAAGEFQSTECRDIFDSVMAHLNKVVDGVISGTTTAVECENCGPCVHSGKN